MATVVHLLTRDPSPLVSPVIEADRLAPETNVIVVVLEGAEAPALPPDVPVRRVAEGDLDYPALLDLIFDADRVITW